MKRIAVILGCALLLSSCKPQIEKDAEKIPVQFVFKAPGVSIPIRYLPDPQPGGLNQAQVDILKLLLGSVPPTLLKGVKFIALYPATDLPNTATGEAGGYAASDGAIIIRTPLSAATPDVLNSVLTHEIGHTVENHVLSTLD